MASVPAGAGGVAGAVVGGIGDLVAGLLADAHHGLAGQAHVEMDEALAEQPRRLIHPIELGIGVLRGLVALGQRQRLARIEADVPAAIADPARARDQRLQPRRRVHHARERGRMRVGVGADHDRQIGHRLRIDRLQHDAVLVDQVELALILPDRRRLALDDVDEQRVGQPPRDARVRHPAILQQLLADLAEVDERHRSRILVERDRIDRQPVHMVDALDLDTLDRETCHADQFAELGARRLRQPERERGRDDRQRDEQRGELVEPVLELLGGHRADRQRAPRRLLGARVGGRDAAARHRGRARMPGLRRPA